jgi:lipopolysaccharide/colanic/teichoic acid biosynthesis glycosyltransferase/GGDEF domain-containing protein
MREERLRSERYETPLSLVIIDINGLTERFVTSGSISGTAFFKHVAAVLRNSTREYDIKGWYQDGQAGILTPNTDEAGARALTRNLVTGLTQRFGFGSDGRGQNVSRFIRIASLPSQGSYLAANGDSKATKPRPPSTQQYRLSFPASHPTAMHYQSVKDRVVEIALVSWPISIELLTQEEVRKLQLLLKRAMDIIGSLFGIALFGPLMLLIALLVKLSSPGSVLFRQVRLGFLGKPFTFLKFRSMKLNCDQSTHREYVTKLINGQNDAINKGTTEQPVYKITDDCRITPVGRFLRKTSLDELPQFFNVLMGDMSLVGPPPPPHK